MRVLDAEREVVAQVVEAELVVRSVGDVGTVGCALFLVVWPAFTTPHGHAEELVDRSHPVRVAAGRGYSLTVTMCVPLPGSAFR